uniref:Uncharacterized protein n=1 Tax=Panagrolaimus superbus TaxID=310955 RepID=A0A914XUS9_9BILA
MKFFSTVLIIVIGINCLLFSEFEAKKVKAEKIKEKVVHKHVKPQPDQPQLKPTEHTNPKVNVKQAENHVDLTIERVKINEKVNKKNQFKPTHEKVLSEYEQCKFECKKKRDKVSAQKYVDQLTEELKLAKEYLATQEATDISNTKIEIPPVNHLDDLPVVENPIIEVNLHQTVKDEI